MAAITKADIEKIVREVVGSMGAESCLEYTVI